MRDYKQYLSSVPAPSDSAAVLKELEDMIEEKKRETKAAANPTEYPYARHTNPNLNSSGNATRPPYRADEADGFYGKGSGATRRNGSSWDEDDDPIKFTVTDKLLILRTFYFTICLE